MKIYIAGPMSGIDQFNFPAFFEAERQLLALGHEVINPAHNDGKNLEEALEMAGTPDRPNNPWGWYMRRDLPHVLEVEALCLLPGWQNSKGALLEVHVAEALGLPLLVLKDGKLIPRISAIGISGYARSGKDSIANYLVDNHGYIKMSFADPMRKALYKLDPEIRDRSGLVYGFQQATNLFGWEEMKNHFTEYRGLMQRFGTEVGREMFGENFWVDQAMKSIPDGAKVVFADVRFPNEADAIRELHGQIWRVERDGIAPANSHVSETALDNYNFDEKIHNSSDLDWLHAITEELMLR